MTTMITPAAEPSSPGSTQKDQELINYAQKDVRKSLFLVIGWCVPFGIGTAITAQTVLLDFTRVAAIAWLLAFSITTSAHFASYFVGSKWHESKATSVAIGALWCLVGAVLVDLCLRHSVISGPAADLGLNREVSSEPTALVGARDLAQAAILGALYFLGGLVTALKGYMISRTEALTHLTTVEAGRDTATPPGGH